MRHTGCRLIRHRDGRQAGQLIPKSKLEVECDTDRARAAGVHTSVPGRPLTIEREGSIYMSEATHSTPRAKAKAAIPGPTASAFEFPKFEIPNFEMPKMEVPAAFREFAEKG